MPSKNWTKITIGLFALIIFCISFITGQSIDQNGFKWLTGANSAVILLLLIFDKWIWRWPFIRRISELAGRPVIHGTWRGEIEFDRDAENNAGKLACYLSIYQTFTTVEVRGYFETSQSHSITAAIDRPRATEYRLVYAYHSEAPHGKRDENRPNDGTAILNIIGRPVETLGGSYFTDRGGSGRVILNEHSNKLSESFSQASKLKFTKLA